MKLDPRDIAPHHEDHRIRRRLLEASWLLFAVALLSFALQYMPIAPGVWRQVLTWLAIGFACGGALALVAAGVMFEVHKLKIMWRDHHHLQ